RVFPSGENTGDVSVALFAVVRFRGGAEPSAGAAKRSRFVDHASSLLASRAANTRVRPSAEKAASSGPPKGLLGPSASIPRITSTAGPPVTGRTNQWARVPLPQVSQW